MGQSIRVTDHFHNEASTASSASCGSTAEQIDDCVLLGQMTDSQSGQTSELLQAVIKRQHKRDALRVEQGELDPRALFLFSEEDAANSKVTFKSIDYEDACKDYS